MSKHIPGPYVFWKVGKSEWSVGRQLETGGVETPVYEGCTKAGARANAERLNIEHNYQAEQNAPEICQCGHSETQHRNLTRGCTADITRGLWAGKCDCVTFKAKVPTS